MLVLVWLPLLVLLGAGWLLGVPVPSWLQAVTGAASVVATFIVALLSARRSSETEEQAWWQGFW